ncbi:MAG TPA: enoyl-CoA hydratase-related protein [Acidimicrobiales bacterium]|nr:enoyl-CoA hydratase-related protein [Acidimicrobiales bacterium]
MSELVLYEVEAGVATITLNRPERMNTMNGELLAGALEALETAAGDREVKAVIFTGTGRAFCAGGDLQGMAGGGGGGGGGSGSGRRPSVEAAVGNLRASMRTSQLLREMPKVTFAAINGACAGAGLAWACAADIRYCAESAVFNTAFMTAGLSGDFGGTWTLPRIVGPAKARELYLMAEKFGADEAARIGLVSAVLPPEDLMAYTRERAQRAAGFAPLTLAAIKANLNDSPDVSFAEMLDREAGRHIRAGLTEDAREAAAAFLQKRPPVFKGR